MSTHTVTVTREDDWWLAHVHGLDGGAHTEARTLTGLDAGVRDLIVLAEDLPDEAAADLDVTYRYDVDDETVRAAGSLAAERARVAHVERVRTQTARLAVDMRRRGYSVRDTAAALGITPGRVTQLERQRVA